MTHQDGARTPERPGSDLRGSQEMLQLIMDNIPQAIFWKDRASVYLGCNVNFARAAGVGTSAGIVGKTDFELPWANEEAASYRDFDERVMAADAPEYHIMETQWQANGERAWVDTNKVPLHDAEGRVVGILGTFEDITDRKRTQEQLQRAHDELELRVRERTAELATANEQLEAEIAERRQVEVVEREQRALAEALRETAALLNSTLDLDEVLDRILSEIERVVPHASASIVLVDDGVIAAARRRGRPAGGDPGGSSLVGRSIDDLATLRTMAATHRPLIVEDTDASTAWADLPGEDRVRSYLGAPIVAEASVIGFINLNGLTPGFFQPVQAERLGIFANQAAIAIGNARLYKRAEELAAIKERQRLARDLHDAVSQTLWTMKITADMLPVLWEQDRVEGDRVLDDLRRLTTGALAEMRTLLLELRPAALVETDLGDLLAELAAATMSRKRIQVDVVTHGRRSLPPDVQVACYRIAQEALNNVSKHARATRAVVDLRRDARRVALTVTDDGRGFDPALVTGDRHGLRIMRERAESIDAALAVESGAAHGVVGGGTVIRLTWRGPTGRTTGRTTGPATGRGAP